MTLPEIFDFLKDLSENNNKDWFKAQEKRYKEAKASFSVFVEMLIYEISKFDASISGLEAKKCTFRIYRDLRFSKNQLPYKTNFGAFIASGGRKSPFAGYYIHMEPDKSFIGGGIYMPEPHILKAIRTRIVEHPTLFLEIIRNKAFHTVYPEIYGEKLKTAPQGFSKEFEYLELIQPKHYALAHELKNEIWSDKHIVTKLGGLFKLQYPFNQYLTRKIHK
jgi:uncharacterized protein (TIGR02453 family)